MAVSSEPLSSQTGPSPRSSALPHGTQLPVLPVCSQKGHCIFSCPAPEPSNPSRVLPTTHCRRNPGDLWQRCLCLWDPLDTGGQKKEHFYRLTWGLLGLCFSTPLENTFLLEHQATKVLSSPVCLSSARFYVSHLFIFSISYNLAERLLLYLKS